MFKKIKKKLFDFEKKLCLPLDEHLIVNEMFERDKLKEILDRDPFSNELFSFQEKDHFDHPGPLREEALEFCSSLPVYQYHFDDWFNNNVIKRALNFKWGFYDEIYNKKIIHDVILNDFEGSIQEFLSAFIEKDLPLYVWFFIPEKIINFQDLSNDFFITEEFIRSTLKKDEYTKIFASGDLVGIRNGRWTKGAIILSLQEGIMVYSFLPGILYKNGFLTIDHDINLVMKMLDYEFNKLE